MKYLMSINESKRDWESLLKEKIREIYSFIEENIISKEDYDDFLIYLKDSGVKCYYDWSLSWTGKYNGYIDFLDDESDVLADKKNWHSNTYYYTSYKNLMKHFILKQIGESETYLKISLRIPKFYEDSDFLAEYIDRLSDIGFDNKIRSLNNDNILIKTEIVLNKNLEIDFLSNIDIDGEKKRDYIKFLIKKNLTIDDMEYLTNLIFN